MRLLVSTTLHLTLDIYVIGPAREERLEQAWPGNCKMKVCHILNPAACKNTERGRNPPKRGDPQRFYYTGNSLRSGHTQVGLPHGDRHFLSRGHPWMELQGQKEETD